MVTTASASAPRIGRYQLSRRLGRGSQGSVYLARDPRLNRQVAIKLLHPDVAARDGRAALVPAEARTVGRLRHPGIASIHDIGEHRGLPFLVFEYVDGVTLREWLSGARPQREQALAIIAQLADAIAHAHGHGVLHLDLTPANIMVEPSGQPKIMDFGLARLVDASQTGAFTIGGTLRYMAPEHFTGAELGTHTDVFCLSLIFCEILTGTPVIKGRNLPEVHREVRSMTPDLSALGDAEADRALADFLRSGLAVPPAARHADGAALRDALAVVGTGAAPAEAARDDDAGRRTLEFLLRRLRKNKDFPALSRSIFEVNRLTSDDADASVGKLANVILRDYALSSKLLKLANSAYYGVRVEVTRVTDAIRLLGFERVRTSANGLAYFSQVKSDTPELRDALLKSFVSGLVARHLAQQAQMKDVEEAFICAMFHDVGEHLTIHYLPEEHEDVELALRDGAARDKRTASEQVLGISYAKLGAAVARTWRFPESIVTAIEATSSDDGAPENEHAAALSWISRAANDLCDLAGRCAPGEARPLLDGLAADLVPRLAADAQYLARTLAAASRKAEAFAPMLGIDSRRSPYMQALAAWCEEPADGDIGPPAKPSRVAAG